MSDNDSDTQILTAEYRDGQLQIVDSFNEEGTPEDISSDAQRFIQVLDPEKGLVNLDSLNLTLVRCEGSGGDSSYRLVTNAECERDGDASVTCMLQDDDDVSYVVVEGDEDQLIILENSIDQSNHNQIDHNNQSNHNYQINHNQSNYNYQSSHNQSNHTIQSNHTDPASDPQMYIDIELPPIDDNDYTQNCHGNVDQIDLTDQQADDSSAIRNKVSPEELIQRAKRVQQRLLGQLRRRPANTRPPQKNRGPKRHIRSPQDILVASPGFKLFLYSCKLCSYKCNAQKELTKHRKTVHTSKARANNRAMGVFQCAKCPFRAGLMQQLTTHIEEKHHNINKMQIGRMLTLDSQEVFEADVLVCGACGFECGETAQFKDHITNHHM